MNATSQNSARFDPVVELDFNINNLLEIWFDWLGVRIWVALIGLELGLGFVLSVS